MPSGAELDLKFESRAEPHIEGWVERRRLTKVGVQLPLSTLPKLVDDKHATVVRNIEEVCHEFQFHPFGQADRIIRMEIKLRVER